MLKYAVQQSFSENILYKDGKSESCIPDSL